MLLEAWKQFEKEQYMVSFDLGSYFMYNIYLFTLQLAFTIIYPYLNISFYLFLGYK